MTTSLEHMQLLKSAPMVGSPSTAEWRLKFIKGVADEIRAGRMNPFPVMSHSFPPPPERNAKHTDAEHAQLLTNDERVRLWDARDEHARRLRTTLLAEAWLREHDVTDSRVQKFADFHRNVWKLAEPCPADVTDRERIVQQRIALVR